MRWMFKQITEFIVHFLCAQDVRWTLQHDILDDVVPQPGFLASSTPIALVHAEGPDVVTVLEWLMDVATRPLLPRSRRCLLIGWTLYIELPTW